MSQHDPANNLEHIRVSEADKDTLSAVIDSLPDAFYLFDRTRRLCRFNPPAASVANVEKLDGKSCCEMFWKVPESSECVVDRAINDASRVEVEMLAGQNGEEPVLLVVQPLENGGALVIGRDISRLRQAEREAREHKSFMANLADRSPDDIYTLDKDGRITWLNGRAESGNLLMSAGRFLMEFIAEDSQEMVSENLKRALQGEDAAAEVRVVSSDGTIFEVEAHTSPLWKEGEVAGVLVFLRDITERKRTQELTAQSDKLRAVGELAAGVAHNLNNSLTVIQGRAQLLLMRSTDETTLKSLKVITDAVDDGSKTLRRILEFARREAVAEFSPVELGDLLTSSVEIARPKWQSKTAQRPIEVRVEGNGPVYVLGDQAELREVVLNLIFNAVDAMPDGGLIELGTRAEIESGCFWVADTGAGMPAETAARIFEPFFTTKGKRGTGLGLSASHGIISRHKGEILVVSDPGEGTRFEVRLPICDGVARFVKNSDEIASEAQLIGSK